MESAVLVFIVLVSEVVAIFFICKLWARNSEHISLKIMLSVILIIPILGPVGYLLVYTAENPQSVILANKGPKGDYTHGWILARLIIDKESGDAGVHEVDKSHEKNPK